MSAKIIDGKILAQMIRQALKEKIERLKLTPVLAVVLAGSDPASCVYVWGKQKAAAEVGIETRLYHFEQDVSQKTLEELIERLNKDPDVNGILVQLPLPKQIDSEKLLNLIDYHKDVDGFHPYNIGLLQNGNPNAVVAATPKGVMRLLAQTGVEMRSKNAVVIGRSQIVGKPTAMLLLQSDCTVTVAHSQTKNLEEIVKKADIVVAACGVAKLVKADWLKEGAVVIDVGINRVDGKLCGDVDFDAALLKASYITPVPGGVGPMTIAMLLENTLEVCLRQNA